MPDMLSNAKANQVSPAGNVLPMTFICVDGLVAGWAGSGLNAPFLCRQATATTDFPLGLSQTAVNIAPNLIFALTEGATANPDIAGSPGQQIQIFTAGDVAPVRLGAAVTAGQPITNDTAGKGVPIAQFTASRYMAGIALQSGAAGDLIEVYMIPGRA